MASLRLVQRLRGINVAFLDFLDQGIGGMQQAQRPNITGDAGIGTPQPVGPTWGDALKAGMTYGSSPGSSGPTIAGSMNYSPATRNTIQSLQPTTMQKTPVDKNAEQNDDSLGKIVSWFMSLLGAV